MDSTRTARLFAPVDGASLAVFRMAFGAILVWEVLRFAQMGWIDEYFIEPEFHFTYGGFRWVRPLPGWGMHALFGGLGLLATAIALGAWTRLSAALFCVGFSYVFLIEKARYLNHFYLVILLLGLMAIVPAGRVWSWDARGTRQRTVPAWSLFLLRTQLGLVYMLAAVAKLNVDWLQAQPLTEWLSSRHDHVILGPLLQWELSPWLFSYGGLLLDALAWPLLLWPKTRTTAFLFVCSFHLMNSSLFGIGIFPAMMIASTTLFLEPDWPRRLWAWVRRRTGRALPQAPASDGPDLPPAGAASRRWVLGFLVAYLGFQALFPLRHFLYPGRVSWTEEGHAFAWHMKLRGKHGRATFRVSSPTSGESWLVDPRAELNDWQYRKLCGRPDMVLEYAHHLADRMAGEGHGQVEVRANVVASLNSRPAQRLIDPDVDLSQVEWTFVAPSPWILPLEPQP